MQITSDANQLSAIPQAGSRYVNLRVWMVLNDRTFPQFGRALGGITANAVRLLCKQERISHSRHKELLACGIPAHLLPPAQDVPRGRPPRQ